MLQKNFGLHKHRIQSMVQSNKDVYMNCNTIKLSGDTLLDLGCGDGALLNCPVELTDSKEYSWIRLCSTFNKKFKR